MSRRVFHINAEVRPVTAATLDPSDVAGAAVRCLVPADSPDDALAVLSARLRADGLELYETEWCVDFDETEWTRKGDSPEKGLAEQARTTGEVQYGTFYAWGHDAPDAR
jgi:hypothetical protein